MSRPRNSVPSYLPHKQSGRARAVWTDLTGTRHFRMLPGPFNSSESRTAFARLQLELAASPPSRVADPVSITVAEVLKPRSVAAPQSFVAQTIRLNGLMLPAAAEPTVAV